MLLQDVLVKKLGLTTEDIPLLEYEITKAKDFIKSYCNDPLLDVETSSFNGIIEYLVIREMNPETSFRAGKSSESAGASYNYLTDLPEEYQKVLLPYMKSKKKVKFY